MLQHPAPLRTGFREAADAYLATIRAIGDDQWDQEGALGEWTVRELAAHTLRAFTTIETYLQATSPDDAALVGTALAGTVGYYRSALAAPGIHRDVAERGRKAGAEFTDPVGQAMTIVGRVLQLVDDTPDDERIAVPAGPMLFSEYLPTRLIEVGLHTIDLQRATGQRVELPDDAVAAMLTVLTQMVDGVELLCALTGRGQLTGVNVLG